LGEWGSEGDRLPGTGAATSEDVLACQHVRQGGGLNRERLLRPQVGERTDDVASQAEVGEGHALDVLGLDGVGLEAIEDDILGRREGRLLVARRVEGGVAARALGTVVELAARALVEVATGTVAAVAEVATGTDA